jgi:hypothetical protein
MMLGISFILSDGSGNSAGPGNPANKGAAAQPALVDDPALRGPGTYHLGDLHDQAYEPGPPGWSLGKNGDLGNPEHSPILVNKTPYPKGMGMHPPLNKVETKVSYVLSGKARRFQGAVAVNDDGGPATPVRFKVFGDGKQLWESAPVSAKGVEESFEIDVRGVQVLELRVFVDGWSNHGCHAVWLDPRVVVE